MNDHPKETPKGWAKLKNVWTSSKPVSKKFSEQEESDAPLDALEKLLEEDWSEEPGTGTHIYINSRTPTSRKEKPEPSRTTKTVTALVILVTIIIEVLRELGVVLAK